MGYAGSISGAVDLERSGGGASMDLTAYFSFDTMVGRGADVVLGCLTECMCVRDK